MSSQFCGSFAALIRRSLLTVSEYCAVSVAAASTNAQRAGRMMRMAQILTQPGPKNRTRGQDRKHPLYPDFPPIGNDEQNPATLWSLPSRMGCARGVLMPLATGMRLGP